MKHTLSVLALFAGATRLIAAPAVETERSESRTWEFTRIPRPSRSAVSRDAKISIFGANREVSCLSLAGLRNGVLPWVGMNKRDAFAFSNFDLRDGSILMDLGKPQPVAAVAAYSFQQPAGSYCNGSRSPQFYTLYGSAAEHPDPKDAAAWTKIAEVDTRKLGRGGRHGSFVRDDKGGLLGNFRWIRFDTRHLAPAKTTPNLSNTWFTELDVHTPETLKTAGDAIMAGSELEETVVVFKTHFDIGFTHRPGEIVNIYRTSFIDGALNLIDASRKLPASERFVWTLPSWVVEQMLFSGQDPTRRERIVRAIKEGSLVCHAFPVSTETEGMDLEDVVEGLSIHTKLARSLGVPLSRAGKTTDVPSQSWIWPTVCANAGIDFMHIGCNPCNERPDVPLLFDWEGPDGSKLLTFLNQGYGTDIYQGVSYGNIYPPKDWPYKHWLSLHCGCDNTPPPPESQVRTLFSVFKRDLPKVRVKLGTMEQFSDGIRAEQKAGAQVPVVRQDMPDCWIHGDGSLPTQDAAIHRARADLAAANLLDMELSVWGVARPDISRKTYQAYENLVMFGEHTWGGARNLQGRNAYADKDFAKTIANDPTCKYLQVTWNDKAAYADKAAATGAKLAQAALTALASSVKVEGPRAVVFNPLPRKRDALVDIPGHGRVTVKDLPPSGYRTLLLKDLPPAVAKTEKTDRAVVENAFLKVTVDRARGGIVSIIEKKTGRELVDTDAKYAFGQYLYQRFDRKQVYDYDNLCEHLDGCLGIATGWNVRADLPGNVPYAEAVPVYAEMNVGDDGAAKTVVLRAPAAGLIASKVTTTFTLPADQPWIEVETRLDDKQPDYWPEAGSTVLPAKVEGAARFRIGRLGGVADPAKDFARGSNRTYGYLNTGGLIAGADGKGLAFCPLDHGITSFGEKGLGVIDRDFVPTVPEARVSLFNNLWTINFPYWVQGTVTSRIRVWASGDLSPAALTVPAQEVLSPVQVGMADGPAGTLPPERAGLTLSRPGVRLTALMRNPDGEGALLRLWEQAGEDGELVVTLPEGLSFTKAQPVNLRGVKMGEPVEITNGRFSFRLGKYAPASFVLTPLPAPASTAPGVRTTTLLSECDLGDIVQGWGNAEKDLSVSGEPLKIGGRAYASGIGTHAAMTWTLALDGKGVSFSSEVGVQDHGPGKGSVEFFVIGDGRILARSGVVRGGDKAVPLKADLAGVKSLTLQVGDGGDGIASDHADWIAPTLVHDGELE